MVYCSLEVLVMSDKTNKEAKHGKQNNQKMKPYLVMQYLLKYSDKENVVTAYEIVDYLEECGITAERRSVYRDIEEINKASLIIENDYTIEEAEQELAEDEYNESKLIIYDKSKKGFYACRRNYDITDIKLLAECVYSAKFLDKSQSDFLIDIICNLINEREAETIKHDVLLTDRVRTNNAEVISNIAVINEAMSKKINGEKHIPEKISFKYLKHSISDVKNQVERRHGEKYIVNPFALLINDGNYYLLAFDEKKSKFIHYRIDRMKSVERIGAAREGEKEFKQIDLKNYTQRVFSMYGGVEKRVTLRFINLLLDTAIDRFGKKDVQYFKSDEKHFTVSAKVEVSNQFFGWLLGFGKGVKVISPPEVKEEFAAYIDKIRDMY